MRIIGVDFHVRQQTIAIFDTETKELVKKTLKHEGRRCGNSILHYHARCRWGSRPPDRCTGF